jgi:hypothetical protein
MAKRILIPLFCLHVVAAVLSIDSVLKPCSTNFKLLQPSCLWFFHLSTVPRSDQIMTSSYVRPEEDMGIFAPPPPAPPFPPTRNH